MTAIDSRLVSALEEKLRRRPAAERVGWKLGLGERERLGGIAVRVGPNPEIDGYAAALELVDLSGPRDDAYWAIADNVFHRAVAFGPWSDELPAEVEGRLR